MLKANSETTVVLLENQARFRIVAKSNVYKCLMEMLVTFILGVIKLMLSSGGKHSINVFLA